MAVNITKIDPKLSYRNTVDGIVVYWNDLSTTLNFNGYLLLRKRYGYSETIDDGDVVFNGKTNSVKDTTAKSGVSYCYTLFLIVSNNGVLSYLTSNFFRKNIIVHTLGQSADKMYKSLPGIYRTEDIKVDSQLPRPLYRYMQLYGYQLDKVENLLGMILDNIDIDTCDDKFLPVIAKWLGVTYDWSIPVSDNRTLIKLMIENYSVKGTYDGLVSLLQNISKSKVEVVIDKTLTPSNATADNIKKRRTVNVNIYLDDEQGSWVGSKQEKVMKVIFENVPKKNAFFVKIVVLFEYADKYDKSKAKTEYPSYTLEYKTSDTYDKQIVEKNVDYVVGSTSLESYKQRGTTREQGNSGTRGVSLRGKNVRGLVATTYDLVYKNGVLQKAVVLY